MTIRKTDVHVQSALRTAGGNVKAAAALLGISRQSLHERLARKPHLRPQLPFDPAGIAQIVTSMQMLDIAIDRGEWWAVKLFLARSPHWNKKLPRRPRPKFSDEEVEDLIVSLGGDLEFYWATKKKISPPGKLSLRQRRIAVEIAASVTLKIPCNQVWARLRKAWVELPILQLVQNELSRREWAKTWGDASVRRKGTWGCF